MERITDQIYKVFPMDGDVKQSRVVSVDRMEPYREGHRYDTATTAVPLSPDHPLVRRANNDPHAENIIQSKANEEDAANPWWHYSTHKEEEVSVPAMPQQQPEVPGGELLPPTQRDGRTEAKPNSEKARMWGRKVLSDQLASW